MPNVFLIHQQSSLLLIIQRERERAVNEAQWAEEIEQGYCAYTY
jgi:hypothetical protein